MGQVVDCFLHPPLGASQLLQGLLVVQVVDWHQHLLLEALHLVQVVDFFLQPPHSPLWLQKPLYFGMWSNNSKSLFLAIKQPRLVIFYAPIGAVIPA